MILQVCQDRWEAVSGLQESGKKRFLSYQLTSLLINQQQKQISPAFGISHKPATLNLILFAIKVIIDSFLQGDSTLASISQPADEFTFGHTGHMAIILGRYDFTNIITILCIWPPYLTFTLMVQIRCFVYKCHIIDRWCMIFYCLGMTRSRQSPVCLRTSRRRLRVGSVPPKGTSFESSHQDPTKTLSTKRNFLWSPSKLCCFEWLGRVGSVPQRGTLHQARLFPPKGIIFKSLEALLPQALCSSHVLNGQ